MLKNKVSEQKLFFPFACLLALMCSISFLGYFLKGLVQIAETPYDFPVFSLDQTCQLACIVLYAGLIFLVRNIPFKTIFKSVLGMTAIGLLLSGYLFPNSYFNYFFNGFFFPQAFPVLAWMYINQITNKNEGIKYYFALILVASLLIGLVGGLIAGIICVIPQTRDLLTTGSMPMTPTFFVWTGIAILGLVLACDRWIHRRVRENEEAENEPIEPSGWVTALYLGIISYGLFAVTLLNESGFTQQTNHLLIDLPENYLFQAKYMMSLGFAIIGCLVLSVWLGPKIIRRIGWHSTVMIAPVVAFIALLLPFAKTTLTTLSVSQIIPVVFATAWIAPLTQIAFISYAKKSRFSLQAWAVLVVAGSIQLIAGFAHFEPTGALVASCIVLALMVGSTLQLAKHN